MLPFQLRPYRPADCAALAALFYDTVHTVNTRGYTVMKAQQVLRKGVRLKNYVMRKVL